MKTFSVAVAVAIMLTFIFLQESSAVPVTGEQELEEAMSNDSPVAVHEETSVESWKMPYNRQKRGLKCRVCCGCCIPGVCGVCCTICVNVSNSPKMKTFGVAVAVAVMLTFICIQESVATLSEVQVPEEMMSDDSPVAAHEETSKESWMVTQDIQAQEMEEMMFTPVSANETSVDSWMMPYKSRQKRGIKCRFCCSCCRNRRAYCGLCCKF
ncbi:uncharacterized protein [Thunnus thynnus]|uniref:uncharacterized protein n=1 Tax=Thunnus thynnus TaxID=8237 RepID=UPI0035281943